MCRVAIDEAAGKLFWLQDQESLHRADLDGGNAEVLYTSPGLLYGFDLATTPAIPALRPWGLAALLAALLAAPVAVALRRRSHRRWRKQLSRRLQM